ncbi:MAG: hypothetical protein NTX64_04245 [Elusimicrobia bacterium]|nr:hypothetical protein [Elusimicrobiota bacterium]
MSAKAVLPRALSTRTVARPTRGRTKFGPHGAKYRKLACAGERSSGRARSSGASKERGASETCSSATAKPGKPTREGRPRRQASRARPRRLKKYDTFSSDSKARGCSRSSQPSSRASGGACPSRRSLRPSRTRSGVRTCA